MQIERRAADRGLIDFEIAGVDDDARRSANGERDAIDGAVGDGDEFDFVGADLHHAAGQNFPKSGGVEQARFREALFYQREGEARAVHRDIEVAQDVRQRADVIFVAVGEDDGAHVLRDSASKT